MLSLTIDQILALAPDDASRKAGQGLSSASKWVSAGSSTRAIWGECQGSGSKPYQTITDTASLAFKCSCPSRKFPCKHGVGMLLYYAKDGSRFNETEEPDWVREWIDKRAQKATTTREDKPVKDEAAQVKRNTAREEKISAGIEELSLWMKDALRAGIIQFPEKGPRYFEEAAKRLIDAQAPGLARTVRALGDINYFGEGWQTEVLDGFARLHLAVKGFQHIDAQGEAIVQDVRNAIGIPQSTGVLDGQPALQDTWIVAGTETESEGALTIEKHWLLSNEGCAGLFLQYVPFGQRPGVSLFPGQSFGGDIVYYPSTAPLRVAIHSLTISSTPVTIPLLEDWNSVAKKETAAVACWPLTRDLPYAIAALRPIKSGNDAWLIEDSTGKHQRLHKGFSQIWKWMALSGGEYLPTVVLGAEHTYRPLGLWHDNKYISLR